MSHKKLFENLGLTASIADEKQKFLNRVDVYVYPVVSTLELTRYNEIMTAIAFDLGLHRSKYPLPYEGISITKYTGESFNKTLMAIVSIYNALDDLPAVQKRFSDRVSEVISLSLIDIGIHWKDGMFYRSGDPILDNNLIDFSLQLLESFPAERNDLALALKNHFKKRTDGVVEKCYNVVEGIVRKVLKNTKSLTSNKADLLKKLNLGNEFGRIIAGYIEYANENHRHSSKVTPNIKEHEIEAFIYSTCIFVRLLVKSITPVK